MFVRYMCQFSDLLGQHGSLGTCVLRFFCGNRDLTISRSMTVVRLFFSGFRPKSHIRIITLCLRLTPLGALLYLCCRLPLKAFAHSLARVALRKLIGQNVPPMSKPQCRGLGLITRGSGKKNLTLFQNAIPNVLLY